MVVRSKHGWGAGEENVSDLSSAIVLADLFAADRAPGVNPTKPQVRREEPPHPPRRTCPNALTGTP